MAIPLLVLFGVAVAQTISPPLSYRVEDCNRYMAQPDLSACAQRNFEAADAVLNRLYRRLRDAQPERTARERLVRDERAWVARKDRACAGEVGPQEGGGSIWPMEMALCQQKATDARIRELQRRLGW